MAEFVEVMRQDERMRRTEESMDFLCRMSDLLSTDPARFEKAVCVGQSSIRRRP